MRCIPDDAAAGQGNGICKASFGFYVASFQLLSVSSDTGLSAAKLEDTSASLKNPIEAREVHGRMRLWPQNSLRWRQH